MIDTAIVVIGFFILLYLVRIVDEVSGNIRRNVELLERTNELLERIESNTETTARNG